MSDKKTDDGKVEVALGVQRFDPKTTSINTQQPKASRPETPPPPKPGR